jgi:hypothetical protein
MFPMNQLQGENSLAALTEIENKTTFGKSFLFDFENGDFILGDGKVKIIEGEQALKVWIKKILKTEKTKYEIYDIINVEYGVSLIDYLNSDLPTGFVYANVQSEISGALANHPDVTEVIDFEFGRDKRVLKVSFTVLTTYGEISEGVSI